MASALVDIPPFAIRLMSPTMSEIPWNTIVPTKPTVSAEPIGMDLLKDLQHRIDSYERALVSVTNTAKSATDVRTLLGVKLDFDVRPVKLKVSPFTKERTALQSSILMTFLTPYRLLDVACYCLNIVPSESQPLNAVPRDCDATPPGFIPLARLQRWPTVLFEFRQTYLESGAADDVEIVSTSPPQARLLKYLVVNSAATNYSKIENNLLLAALHIVSLVGSASDSKRPLDIPDDVEDFVKLLFGSTESAAEAANNLRRVCAVTRPAGRAEDDLTHIRLPLFVSLWISPCALLVPIHLSKVRFHKEKLLSVKMALGNDAPPLLRRIDNVLWKSILRLAQGVYGPRAAIREIISGIPWSELEAVSLQSPMAAWFDLAPCRPVLEVQHLKEPIPSSREEMDVAMTVYSPPPQTQSLPLVPPPNSAEPSPTMQAEVDVATETRPSTAALDSSMNPTSQGTSLTPSVSCMTSQHTLEPSASATVEDPSLRPDTGGGAAGSEPPRRASSRIRDLKSAVKDSASEPTKPVRPATTKQSRSKSKPSLKRSRSLDDTTSRDTQTRSLAGLGGRDDPIDVDRVAALRDPVAAKHFSIKVEAELLTLDGPPRKLSDRQYTAYDSDGVPHTFRPSFHHADYDERLVTLWDRMESSYVHDRPLHVANKQASLFDLIPYDEFVAKRQTIAGLTELLLKLKIKNLVITGCPTEQCSFDAESLRRIRALHAQISIQDYSFPPESATLASTPHTVAGTPQMLLESVNSGLNGKILNALEFPKVINSSEPTLLESDLAAWHHTSGVHSSAIASSYPTSDMYWSLAGTSDTMTFLHADTDGVATGLRVKCGLKVWGIVRERPGAPFSAYDAIIDREFYLDRVTKNSNFDIEAIILRPGDMLLMQPNTIHFVVGPQATICEGFHFYCTSTMQRTIVGVIHCFVAGSFLTNIYHPPTRLILRRILVFYFAYLFEGNPAEDDSMFAHLPDINTIDGLLDLLAACNLAILANVLDGRSYATPNQKEDAEALPFQAELLDLYDRNDIPWDERLLSCKARGIALAILRAVRDSCEVTDSDGQPLPNYPFVVLTQQMSSLLSYKQAAVRHRIAGVPHCSVPKLKVQLNNILNWNTDIRDHYGTTPDWLGRVGHTPTALFISPAGCSVKWTKSPSSAIHGSSPDYLHLGKTELDHKYFNLDIRPEAKRPRI